MKKPRGKATRRGQEFLAKAKRREKHKNNDSFKLANAVVVVAVDCALCGAFKAARHVISGREIVAPKAREIT